MKLSLEERNATDIIAAMSFQDTETVRNVYEAFAVYSACEIYTGKDEIVIPNVCKLKINIVNAVDSTGKICRQVELKATAFENFSKEILDIKDGNELQIEKFVDSNIKRELKNITK